MNVLVDTSVWSLALRRSPKHETAERNELVELIKEGRVAIIGAIRQEILSGVKAPEQYKDLRDSLRAFSDLVLEEADYAEAAVCFNRCRAKGVQGSNTDFLICAVSLRRGLSVLTTDKDFIAFARVLGLELHGHR